jgi:Zn-dependent protease
LSLFLIVLLHEFGHQLSCRQVGGKTHDIILWPLGGVAFVSPPQRPGAQLWSIAAGPLVNVALIPVLSLFWSISFHLQWYDTHSDVYDLIENVWFINIGLLIFNMLPIYPLDGGQIVRSLLWFLFGRANSLLVASVIGLIGAAGFIAWAAWVFIKGDSWGGSWIGFISIFVAMRSWSGFKQARALAAVAKLPRRAGFACPSCKTAPPIGAFWRCGKCGTTFDMFLTQATCPNCQSQYNAILCLDCGTASSLGAWMTVPPSNN